MITVLTPLDSEFEKYQPQIKELYEKYQEKICDSNSFLFVVENTFFYAFFKNGVFIGAIYYFMESKKLFLNAFALPKNHLTNIQCLKMSTKWFKKPIYAEAQNRASALCLLRCGFRRVNRNLFCYENSNRA